jgi:hypothetical protein
MAVNPAVVTRQLEETEAIHLSTLSTLDGILPALSVFFVCTVWVPAAVAAVLLLAGIRAWWIPAEVVSLALLALLWRFLFRNLSRKQTLLLIAIVLGSILGAAVVSVFCYDMSFDGRWYHADAILALLHGVNPVYTRISAPHPLWANHYPKATWYFAALTIHAFHNYQLGKIYNFLLMLACGAYAWSFFRRHGLRGKYSVMLTIVTALSPVAAAQMVTVLSDGAMASLMTLIVMTSVNTLFRPIRFDRALFLLSASLVIAIKFTGGVYVVGAVCVMIAARLLLRRRYTATELRRALLSDVANAAAAICLGVLVLGFDPYVTNVRQGLHPFYPVMGPNKVDVMVPNTPPVLLHRNRPLKFLISFFSQTSTIETWKVLKIPFTVNKQELHSLTAPDARLGGWGVFFSGVMLGSLALFLLMKGWRGNASLVLALALVAATSFINPECWWARYVPQIALLPVFLLLPGLRAESGRARMIASALCVILLFNSLLSAWEAAEGAFLQSEKLDRAFAAIASANGPGEYWAYRDPKSLFHYDQFSGHGGIVICGQLEPPRTPLPSGGFPIGQNRRNETEVVLFKGRCSSPPPY